MNKLISLATIICITVPLASTASAAINTDFRYLGWHNKAEDMERVYGMNGDAYRALLRADGLDRSDVNAVYRDDNGTYWVKLDPGASPRGNDA